MHKPKPATKPATKTHEHLLGIYKQMGGSVMYNVVNVNPDPQIHQAYFRPRVAVEMR